MGENAGNGRVVGALAKVRHEWTEGLFYFIFLITCVEAGFIVWDMCSMCAPFAAFVGLTEPNRFTASADMSNLYLALLGVYGGFKEFRKWAQLDDAAANLSPENEEKIAWFGRGTVIVFFWIGLALAATIMKDLRLIGRLPNEVYRVALQSLAVWAGTSASSSLQRKRMKKKSAAALAESQPEDEAGNDRLCEKHLQQMLEYLKANEVIDNTKCQEVTKLNRYQAHRLLLNLEQEGIIKGEGTTKARIYRKQDNSTAAKPLQ